MTGHDSMRLRIAKAVAEFDGIEWDYYPARSREMLMQRAEVMLKALCEPTEAMIDAGAEARERLMQGIPPTERSTVVISPHPAGTIFVAMIKQALAET